MSLARRNVSFDTAEVLPNFRLENPIAAQALMLRINRGRRGSVPDQLGDRVRRGNHQSGSAAILVVGMRALLRYASMTR